MSITVNFEKNRGIVIDDNGKPLTIQINTFKYPVINNNGAFLVNEVNSNISNFVQEQRQLRALDMMKDGQVGDNIANSVYDIAYGELEPRRYFTALKSVEEVFFTFVQDKIEKLEWTKISNSPKDNNSKKIDIDVSFQESGLDSSYFIKNPTYCNDFANEVLDPAMRKTNENSFDFPAINEELNIEKSFLNLFGFINTSIKCKKVSTNKYDFDLNINDYKITKQKQTEIDKNNKKITIDFFMGNKQKNNFIQNQANAIKNSTKIKNALLVCKELGDVLQVLTMFIWKSLNTNQSYCISTCDKVVSLLCIMMNLNYTLAVTIQKTTTTPKVKYIEYYNSDGNKNINIEDVNKKKFIKEKKNIISFNEEIINAFEIIRNQNIDLTISGINNPFKFETLFYDNVIEDLKQIQQFLKDYINDINNTRSINFDSSVDVNNKIKDMKKNFTIVRLIVKLKNGTYKLASGQKYTLGNSLYKNDFSSKFGGEYGSKSFYTLGLRMQFGGTTRSSRIVTSKNSSNRSSAMKISPEYNDENNLKILEFYDEKASFYDKDRIYSGKNNVFDLYAILKADIERILTEMKLSEYFDDFYNILLYYFYTSNEVYYGNDLKKLIKRAITFGDVVLTHDTSSSIKNNNLTRKRKRSIMKKSSSPSSSKSRKKQRKSSKKPSISGEMDVVEDNLNARDKGRFVMTKDLTNKLEEIVKNSQLKIPTDLGQYANLSKTGMKKPPQTKKTGIKKPEIKKNKEKRRIVKTRKQMKIFQL